MFSAFITKHKILLACAFLFLVSFSYRAWDITKQFEVWDEVAVVRYGEIYLGNIADLDFSRDAWLTNKEHPPFSKYFYGATRIVSRKIDYFNTVLDQEYPIGRRYTFQRIISVIVGSISVVLIFLLVKEFYSKKIAFLSALALSFTPYFIGHSKVATQENLISFFTILAVFIFFKALKTNELKNKLYLLAGVVLAVAVSTKYNGFFFLVLFGVLTLINFWPKFKSDWKNVFNNYIIWIPVIVLILFYLMWPWLWSDPIGQFLDSSSRIGSSRFEEYFLGQFPSPHPWYYFFAYFAATTPPILFVGLIAFATKLILNRSKYDIWFGLYFLTPFMASFSPLRMDGIRYIFPIWAPLAIVSTIGLFYLVNLARQSLNIKNKSLLEISTIAFVTLVLVATNIKFHPYYLDYYNFFVGGPKGVYDNRLFDYAYWGEGLRNGVNAVYADSNGAPKSIYLFVTPRHVVPPIEKNLVDAKDIAEADYVVANPTEEWLNKVDTHVMPILEKDFELIYEERLMEAPIVQVYKRKAAN
jgi:4-amino-4-deoxy-L-arabinose transferase-like glycosyltransferase